MMQQVQQAGILIAGAASSLVQSVTDALHTVHIATRQSALAMVQTHFVMAELNKLHPHLKFQIVGMTTAGDTILNQPLSAFSDKGVFTKELDVSLLSGQTQIAVHSLKDLTTILPQGLYLGAVVKRVDVEDVVIIHPALKEQGIHTLAQLPAQAKIGTSSLRRRAMLAKLYPHLQVLDIRGNLNTRLRKLEEGQYDALLLARAGVVRLGWEDKISQILSAEEFPYAVGQAALGIVCREDDEASIQLLASLDHVPTRLCCAAERGLLRGLEGGCKVPIATNSSWCEMYKSMSLRGVVISLDGQRFIDHTVMRNVQNEDEAKQLGHDLAHILMEQGAEQILREIKGNAHAFADPQQPPALAAASAANASAPTAPTASVELPNPSISSVASSLSSST